MDQGGVEIIPQNTLDTGLLANRRIVLWPYASINDDRFTLGDEYLTLKQQPGAERAFKIGVDCNAGIGYYVLNDVVFFKNTVTILTAFIPTAAALTKPIRTVFFSGV